MQIEQCWIKNSFVLNSGQFRIEAYFYHHEEQTRNPDTQLDVLIIRFSLPMAMC